MSALKVVDTCLLMLPLAEANSCASTCQSWQTLSQEGTT